MHPDYIDELIRREQQRDWQRDQDQARLARNGRSPAARPARLARAIVEWLHARLNQSHRRTPSPDNARPTLAYKR